MGSFPGCKILHKESFLGTRCCSNSRNSFQDHFLTGHQVAVDTIISWPEQVAADRSSSWPQEGCTIAVLVVMFHGESEVSHLQGRKPGSHLPGIWWRVCLCCDLIMGHNYCVSAYIRLIWCNVHLFRTSILLLSIAIKRSNIHSFIWDWVLVCVCLCVCVWTRLLFLLGMTGRIFVCWWICLASHSSFMLSVSLDN